MKAFARACLFALPLLAAPSLARAQCQYPLNVNGVGGFQFNFTVGLPKPICAPWYTYFPYNAYFQTPAPVCAWPFWPTGPGASVAPGGAGPDVSRSPRSFQSGYFVPRDIQPVGYSGPPPSYWYGR